jgi:hypothetical protein
MISVENFRSFIIEMGCQSKKQAEEIKFNEINQHLIEAKQPPKE